MKPPDSDAGPALALVLPGNVDTVVSGGNIYDRRLRDGLRQAGADVVVATVDGSWPQPDARSEQELAGALRWAGRVVIVDGMMAAGCPRIVQDAVSSGNDVRVLVHMPLALDTGLDAETAVTLDALEREALHAARGVIATSDWAADELRRRHGLSDVAVAAPGVDPAPLAHGSAPPLILQVGTVSPVKNQLATVAALASLKEFDWTARLIGPSGPDVGYLEQVRFAIKAAGLEDRVDLTGELTGTGLDDQWHAADISVLPSRAETYGMVVAESLARGVPVVVPAGTGAENTLGRDREGRRPGLVIDPGSTDDLAAALASWLSDDSVRQSACAAAENRRAMLTGWENTVQSVLRTLK
ncbi:glycosyltransferase family 4 protein [Arthrobacter sp. H14]|uniref:glycosyltransferase family 4 protein n=1 Tax=Arthrobacter sp. H14 TaxID=1312959 RepID=UPI0004792E4B|nr:glycosyltransferase family 4 protein [Arthrobacter sp. H14]